MKRFRKFYGSITGILVIAIGLLTFSCSEQILHEGKVVFTQIPANSVSEDQVQNQDYRYVGGMQIAMAEMNESLNDLIVLTNDFHSARASEIAYSAESMIFSGQKEPGDVWQIWHMDFKKEQIRQITQSKANCTDPVWLPDGRIAYSKQIQGENSLTYHALFSCYPDGSDEQRITFQPHEDLSATMLNDGRLLVGSRQVYPDQGSLKLLAVHPDGTKAELFYQPEDSIISMSRPWESLDRKVYFSEANQLTSINFNHPLNSRQTISGLGEGAYLSIFPIDGQQALISFKKPQERTFGLSLVELKETLDNKSYYNNSDFHLVEPVVVTKRTLPKKLPSTVNLSQESGYFICMDANRSEIDRQDKRSTKVQVLGINKTLGEVAVEEDGSFYVEIKADEPIRFQTVDDAGEIVRKPSSWMWVRPNERRGCVGCHENREIAPDNIVPKAIEKGPFAMIR